MTLINPSRSGLAPDLRERYDEQVARQEQLEWQPEQYSGNRQEHRPDGRNVGDVERLVSAAAGGLLAVLGLSRGSVPGLIVTGVGGALVYRGLSGRCPAYSALGVDTARPHTPKEIAERGVRIAQALQINKSPEELYAYWRDFTNLPRIMSYLERVDVLDDRRSHWVARAPRLAGGSVEWDAEITRDEPNVRIAWRSLPGSQIESAGEVRFAKGLGDRGTEVHVHMDYLPPFGKLGHMLTSMMGENPKRVIREDLRNFKRAMELRGELPTVT